MKSDGGSVVKACVAVVLMAALVASPVTTRTWSEAAGGAPPPTAAAVLLIESEPAAADVYLDGLPAGQTPLRLSGLTVGDHRVRLVKGGYLGNVRVVSLGVSPSSVRVRPPPRTIPPDCAANASCADPVRYESHWHVRRPGLRKCGHGFLVGEPDDSPGEPHLHLHRRSWTVVVCGYSQRLCYDAGRSCQRRVRHWDPPNVQWTTTRP